eukprot:5954077-Heterocapsa_arctica.AAC.1
MPLTTDGHDCTRSPLQDGTRFGPDPGRILRCARVCAERAPSECAARGRQPGKILKTGISWWGPGV